MSNSNDFRAKALVLRRTNYGETDRILTLVTENERVECLAKGIRKEKSKLSGGVEIFTLSEITYHKSANRELAILTSAKPIRFYQNIITSLDKLNQASVFLKLIDKATRNVNSPEYFTILKSSLSHLNRNVNPKLIESWFLFNLARISGNSINLHYDTNGNKLDKDSSYIWNNLELALEKKPGGNIKSDEIKVMRMLLVSPLSLCARINYLTYDIILDIAKSLNQM